MQKGGIGLTLEIQPRKIFSTSKAKLEISTNIAYGMYFGGKARNEIKKTTGGTELDNDVLKFRYQLPVRRLLQTRFDTLAVMWEQQDDVQEGSLQRSLVMKLAIQHWLGLEELQKFESTLSTFRWPRGKMIP